VIVSRFVSPPPQASSLEINYFAFNVPKGNLEDTDGLTGILRRYRELLATFATALDEALVSTSFNPYQLIPRAFLRSFRTWLPSFQRQARVSSKQFDRIPNALARDLAGAEAVLAELETLTPAQLSAIEECHRVNMKRLRERSIFRWSWQGKIAALIRTLENSRQAGSGGGGNGRSKSQQIVAPPRGGNLMGADLQSGIIRTVLFLLVLVLMFFAINVVTFLPIFARVRAFEDILTIAKAYRKGPGGTSKPSVE
jgi:hypothetical protein